MSDILTFEEFVVAYKIVLERQLERAANNPVFFIYYTTKEPDSNVTEFQQIPTTMSGRHQAAYVAYKKPSFNWFLDSDEGIEFCERNNKALVAAFLGSVYAK